MSGAVILSIKPVFAHRILDGTKTIELRRSAMGLAGGDVVLVYASAPEQCLSFWFRVVQIEVLPVESMWARHQERLGIDRDQFLAYFEGSSTATGLHIGELHALDPAIPLAEIRTLVPGFVPPQGLIVLRDAWGRYADVLSRLSLPLPPDVFPQQGLFQNVHR